MNRIKEFGILAMIVPPELVSASPGNATGTGNLRELINASGNGKHVDLMHPEILKHN